MREYTFRHRHGQSMPYATLLATDDADLFNAVLPAWEKKTGFKYVPYTVVCATTEYRKVPEPPAEFFPKITFEEMLERNLVTPTANPR